VANAVAGEGGWEGWRMRHQTAMRGLEESLAEMTSEKRFSLARLSVAASDLAALASA
jgi:NAD-specific glutamate dehydrogenase